MPSYATKRQETSEALMTLVQAFPPVAEVAGDLIVKSLDVADADVIAERMKLMLPPPIQQAEAAKAQGKTPPDPQIMAKMQEQQQHLDQAAQTMEEMHKQIESLKSGAEAKVAAAKVDAQVKIELALMEQETQERADQMKAATEIRKAEIDAETALRKAEIEADSKDNVARIGAETQLTVAESAAKEPIQEETT